ncbi:MAG: hypothetical protein ABIP54_01895 [Candidatus Andersenbacteria bacterium]
MKYWFLLLAIVLAALRAPEYAIYTFFLLGYILLAIQQIQKHEMSWTIAAVALLPLGITFIAFPRGHELPGLIQLGILIGALTIASYVIAGFRLAISKQQAKKLIK